MTPLLWLLAGGVAGALNALSTWWIVAHLHPEAPGRALAGTLGGVLARWCLAAILLIRAIQGGILAGLLAFAGLWLAWRGMAYCLATSRSAPEASQELTL